MPFTIQGEEALPSGIEEKKGGLHHHAFTVRTAGGEDDHFGKEKMLF